ARVSHVDYLEFEDDRAVTVLGGRKVAGAVSVEVVDPSGGRHAGTIGERRWFVRVPSEVLRDLEMPGCYDHQPPVVLRAAAGPPIWLPVEDEVGREPVADAVTPCWACGECAWATSYGAERMWYPVCERCGHMPQVPHRWGADNASFAIPFAEPLTSEQFAE